MAYPAPSGERDLACVQQFVAENDLERARIEYKREVGNGARVLDEIAAMANTFGRDRARRRRRGAASQPGPRHGRARGRP